MFARMNLAGGERGAARRGRTDLLPLPEVRAPVGGEHGQGREGCTDRLGIFRHTRASSRTGRGTRDRTARGEHGAGAGAGTDLELEPGAG